MTPSAQTALEIAFASAKEGSTWRECVAAVAGAFGVIDPDFDREAFFRVIGYDPNPPAPAEPWDHPAGPCEECGVDHPFACGVLDLCSCDGAGESLRTGEPCSACSLGAVAA